MKKAYNSHENKIKFTYMEQKEYETIDDDIEELETKVSEPWNQSFHALKHFVPHRETEIAPSYCFRLQ